MKLLLLSIAASLATFQTAQAEDWRKTLTKFKPGPFPALKPIHLTYEASYKKGVSIKSGKISFIFGKKDKRYKNLYISQAYGGSNFNTLPYNFNMTSFSRKGSLKPVLLVANEDDKEEKVATTNKYKASHVSHKKVTTPYLNGGKEVKKHTFKASTIHDPLTAMLFIRSQRLKKGDKINLCIHPFSSPYYATVTVLGREKHLGQKAIKLDLALRKINLKDGSLSKYKKMKKTTIWLTDDKARVPLEFRIHVNLKKYVNIGNVRLVLKARQKP